MYKNISTAFLFCFILFSAVFSACTENDDFDDMEIIIGNWSRDYDVNTFVPKNDMEEKVLAYRKQILNEHNIRIREKQIAIIDEYQQLTVNSILAGLPAASIFLLRPDWAMSMRNRGLFFPISESNAMDFSKTPLNQNVRSAFTFHEQTFALSYETGSSIAIFYNKQVFKEAGLDPELPYIMQREGTWTWDNFFEICKILTRDIDNDGIIDRYAMCVTPFPDFIDGLIASNNANYIDRDAVSGKYAIGINKPEFIEALQFAIRLRNEGVMKFPPPDATWSWHHPEFFDGQIAMRYDNIGIWAQLQNMKDDWGVVMFPKGPRSDIYRTFVAPDVLAIPVTFDRVKVDAILRAVDLWFAPVDDNLIAWKDTLYNVFRDPYSIDETYAMLRDPEHHVTRFHQYVPGINTGSIIWELQGDPVRLAESVSQRWIISVEEANERLSF